MNDRTSPARRQILRGLVLCLALPLLAACGGGGDSVFSVLYSGLSINDLSYPSDEEKNEQITIEARASSWGEISDEDIDWELDQTSGDDVSNVTKELSDGNHKVVFRCTAPDKTGTLRFTIKVKTDDYADSESFSIDIR